MARQIVNLAELKLDAAQALRDGLTVDDCPERYSEFEEEWRDAYLSAHWAREVAKAVEVPTVAVAKEPQ